MIFYQGGPIDHVTHVPGPVSQLIAESDYNAACTAGTALAYFRMLIYELLNKDTEIFPQEAPLIALDSKSDIFIAKNGKVTKDTRKMSRRSNFVRIGEKCKIHNIDWCEGGLQLADIDAKNVGEHDLTPRTKYIMVRLEN